MSQRTEDQIYDIDSYTDKELYDILDVNMPTDRELEAKIIFLIRKYQNIQNESGDKLAFFFEKIYSRFFESEENERKEGFDQLEYTNPTINQPSYNGFTEDLDTIVLNTTQVADQSIINENIRNELSIQTNPSLNPLKSYISPNNNQTQTISTSAPETTTIGYTQGLDYTKDHLNPILKQTVKRIISIDSQYRDNKQALSTDFTFNLSDPLKDVVSIKLYSVQIPYTWYTINNAFGSNFFYLKGKVPGIDDGKHDYQVEITSGNYSPSDLVFAINNSVRNLATIYTDTSFATTNVSYNQYTSLCTTNIDITKQFNETGYSLSFNESNWIQPTNDASYNRLNSIPSFLGFDIPKYYPYNNYYPYKIKSIPFIYNTITANEFASNRNYNITSINNFITIYKYIGVIDTETNGITKYNSPLSVIDFSFNITLSIIGLCTANDIITDLSNQIQNSKNLLDVSNCYIKRIDTDNTSIYQGKSYYELSLKLDRFKVINIQNSKIAIVFPDETNNNSYTLWSGRLSCFNFKEINIEINEIISDTPPLSQEVLKFIINTSPYIKLHCNKYGFDTSLNDYIINIANSTTGYTLVEYINAINNGIINTNYYI